MSMYKYVKMLQPMAEEIGQVEELKMNNKSPYWPDGVKFEGITQDGKQFTLELTIKEEKKDA